MKSWDVQRQPRLFNILTDEKPYHYLLKNLIDNSQVAEYIAGSKLTLAKLKNLRANKILQCQYRKNGYGWYLVAKTDSCLDILEQNKSTLKEQIQKLKEQLNSVSECKKKYMRDSIYLLH